MANSYIPPLPHASCKQKTQELSPHLLLFCFTYLPAPVSLLKLKAEVPAAQLSCFHAQGTLPFSTHAVQVPLLCQTAEPRQGQKGRGFSCLSVCQTLSQHAHLMGPTSWSGMPLAIHLEQQQRDKAPHILPANLSLFQQDCSSATGKP